MSRIDVMVVGAGHAALAYADRETGKPTATPPAPVFVNHRFYETVDHQLGHDIDGRLVAIVPPEGMKDYAEIWPDCADLVAALKKPLPSEKPPIEKKAAKKTR